MSIIFTLIAFLNLYFSEELNMLKEGDQIYLNYYEYSYNLSEISLNLTNEVKSIIDSTSCHLAYIKSETDKKEILDFYSSYLNRQWILYMDNKTWIDKILGDYNKLIEDKKIYLMAIIIPNTMKYNSSNYHGTPILEISENYTEYMEKWDMRNIDKNIFFTLEIKHAIEFYPEIYFLLLSLIVLITTFSLLLFWKIKIKKLNPQHVLPMNKVSLFLIYLNNLLCFILIIKSISIRGTKVYEESESSILLDTALITLNGIHRTVLWFILLILSYGWNISLQQINPRDCKFFLKMILLIFFALSIDQILDVIFDPIFRVHVSEIKNTFVYFILIYIMLKKINKNIRFLKMKIRFVGILLPQYINAMLYKIKLFVKFRIILIAYYILFLSVIILQKTLFYKYDEMVFESYNYLALDCLLVYIFLILFRPKELPENYNVNLGDNIEGEDGNIYQYHLPKYSEANLKIPDLTKKQVESCKKNEIPIIIIGPNSRNLNNSGNIENIDNDININSNNSSINNYFLNLNIGYANNNK